MGRSHAGYGKKRSWTHNQIYAYTYGEVSQSQSDVNYLTLAYPQNDNIMKKGIAFLPAVYIYVAEISLPCFCAAHRLKNQEKKASLPSSSSSLHLSNAHWLVRPSTLRHRLRRHHHHRLSLSLSSLHRRRRQPSWSLRTTEETWY